MNLKRGKYYLLKDGGIYLLTSLFTVNFEGNDHHAPWFTKMIPPHTIDFRMPIKSVIREANWQEAFDKWLDDRIQVESALLQIKIDRLHVD